VELTALAPDLMMLDFPLSSFSDFKNMKARLSVHGRGGSRF
jgi:hypothetical protein